MARFEPDRLPLLLATVLVVIGAGGALDLALDAPSDWRSAHVLFELALIAVSLAMAAYLWRGWYATSRELVDVRRDLDARRAERNAWRRRARSALEGLGKAVDAQFRDWGLTPAEREVALLLLKGYTHARIAHMTDRSERTARQHAVAVYRKAGLGGRAELAAFFLDDLMLPEQEIESGEAVERAGRG